MFFPKKGFCELGKGIIYFDELRTEGFKECMKQSILKKVRVGRQIRPAKQQTYRWRSELLMGYPLGKLFYVLCGLNWALRFFNFFTIDKHSFSPSSVSTLKGSCGRSKWKWLIKVLHLGVNMFLQYLAWNCSCDTSTCMAGKARLPLFLKNPRIKWLEQNVQLTSWMRHFS